MSPSATADTSPLEIVLYTEGLPFTGNTLEEKALGGSETAFISVARQFAQLGHRVTAYCLCSEEGTFEGVRYLDVSKLGKQGPQKPDLLLCSRFFGVFLQPLEPRYSILWMHDVLVPELSPYLEPLLPRIDAIYCLSQYHRQLTAQALPASEPKLRTTTNGLDFDLIEEVLAEGVRKCHRIMFTSRPERGLFPALQLFAALEDRDLEFLVCTYSSLADEAVQAYEARCGQSIAELRRRGYRISQGSFPKRELYRRLAASQAVIYPTDFPEISCISALEAQACGTVFLTTDAFALRETVGYGGLPQGDQQGFLARLRRVLGDVDSRRELEEKGRRHVESYSWRRVAEDFVAAAQAGRAREETLVTPSPPGRSPINVFDQVGPRPGEFTSLLQVFRSSAAVGEGELSQLAQFRRWAVERLESEIKTSVSASPPASVGEPAGNGSGQAAPGLDFGTLPLISCLTATLGRLRLLKRAIRSYCAQTYPRRELLIVTEGETRERQAITDYLEHLGRDDIRPVFLDDEHLNLGKVRNISMQAARGEILCQWDDDDISHPERLLVQARRLLEERTQACLFTEQLQFLEPERRLAWVDWAYGGGVEGIWRLIPGSLMMYRDSRFQYPESGPNACQGEDFCLLENLFAAGPIAELGGAGHLLVYTYHGRNTFSGDHHRGQWDRSLPADSLRQREGQLRKALAFYALPRPLTVWGHGEQVFAIHH